ALISFNYFVFPVTAATAIYTLSLHDALPISVVPNPRCHHHPRSPHHRSSPNRPSRTLLCQLLPWPSGLPPRQPSYPGVLSSIWRSEEHTSELQSRFDLVCRLLLEKKKYVASA